MHINADFAALSSQFEVALQYTSYLPVSSSRDIDLAPGHSANGSSADFKDEDQPYSLTSAPGAHTSALCKHQSEGINE